MDAIHPVVFSVKCHRACKFAVACSFSRKSQVQHFGLRHTAYRESPLEVKGVGAGLHNLGGVKRDIRGVLDVEEIFAVQLLILHPASRIYALCLNLDVQNGVLSLIRGERQRGIPFAKNALDRHGGLHAKPNCALDWGDFEDGNIRG